MDENKDYNSIYENLRDLGEFFNKIHKITDDFANDKVQMDKELNNFYYTEKLTLNRLSDYFNSIKNSQFSPNFLDEYLPKHGRISTNEDFDIVKDNLNTLSKLKKKKDTPVEINNEEKIGIEMGPLKEFIEKIKNEKIEESPLKRSKIIFQKTKKIKLHLPEFPNDLKWEEITIRFLNGSEVQVTARESVFQSSAEMLGFQNEKRKDKKPNLQWELLQILSLRSGFLNWGNNNLHNVDITNLKKRKQLLSEALHVCFSTVKDEPFFDYKNERGYRIKIQLIPEQGGVMLNVTEDMKDKSDSMDYYNEDNDVNIDEYSKE